MIIVRLALAAISKAAAEQKPRVLDFVFVVAELFTEAFERIARDAPDDLVPLYEALKVTETRLRTLEIFTKIAGAVSKTLVDRGILDVFGVACAENSGYALRLLQILTMLATSFSGWVRVKKDGVSVKNVDKIEEFLSKQICSGDQAAGLHTLKSLIDIEMPVYSTKILDACHVAGAGKRGSQADIVVRAIFKLKHE